MLYLCEGCGPRGHQNLSNSVVEPLHGLIIHTQETLCCPLFCYLKTNKTQSSTSHFKKKLQFQGCSPIYLILQIPDAIFVCELLVAGAALGQDATLKATHVEKQVRVVFAVD